MSKSPPKLSSKSQRNSLKRTPKTKSSHIQFKYTSENHAQSWLSFSITFFLCSIQLIQINCSAYFSVYKSHHHNGAEERYHKETITSWKVPQVIITKYWKRETANQLYDVRSEKKATSFV